MITAKSQSWMQEANLFYESSQNILSIKQLCELDDIKLLLNEHL